MDRTLVPGEPIPWFHGQALNGNPSYAIQSLGGRWITMLLLGSGGRPETSAALGLVQRYRRLFDDERCCFFGVTADPADAAEGRIAPQLPGVRWFLDYDRAISALLRATEADGSSPDYRPQWLLIDPMLRIHTVTGLADGEAFMKSLTELLDKQEIGSTAPVLTVPRVVPPEVCSRLIALYGANGGTDSGFMREVGGKTVGVYDYAMKRRADCNIDDPALIDLLRSHLVACLLPMIRLAFQFEATRIERWIVACYDGETGGHFRAHRDNTTSGTAHRKFAVTINLNADEYDGGDLRFPEFGPATYRAPTGGAVVFSCSMLHEATPVTRGRRYAFLPFLYDDAGARVREANLAKVGPDLQNYRSGLNPSPA